MKCVNASASFLLEKLKKHIILIKNLDISPKVLIWTSPDLKSLDLDMSGPEKSEIGYVRT